MARKTTQIVCVLLLIVGGGLVVELGCFPVQSTHRPDAGQDGAVIDGGPDAGWTFPDAGVWPIPVAEDCPLAQAMPCPEHFHDYQVFADARLLGSEGRFVAASYGGALLGMRPAGERVIPVVLVYHLGIHNWVPIELADPSWLPTRALGILSGDTQIDDTDHLSGWAIVEHHVIVLLCDEAGCALYGIAADDPPAHVASVALTPVPGGEVPTDQLARGLFLTAWPYGLSRGLVCVYGNGIDCFDGVSWTTVLERSVGINGMAYFEPYGPRWVVAVGDGGRILVHDDSGWIEWPSPTAHDLISVASGQFLAAGAADGTLVVGSSTEVGSATRLGDEPIVGLAWSLMYAGLLKGVLSSGCVFRVRFDPLTFLADPPSFEPTEVCFEPVKLLGQPALDYGTQGAGTCAFWMALTGEFGTSLGDTCTE